MGAHLDDAEWAKDYPIVSVSLGLSAHIVPLSRVVCRKCGHLPDWWSHQGHEASGPVVKVSPCLYRGNNVPDFYMLMTGVAMSLSWAEHRD